jgi:hypothetical protein
LGSKTITDKQLIKKEKKKHTNSRIELQGRPSNALASIVDTPPPPILDDVLNGNDAAPVDKMTTTSPLRNKLKTKGSVHDEDLNGEEG